MYEFLLIVGLFVAAVFLVLTVRFLWMVPTELREIKFYLKFIDETLDK